MDAPKAYSELTSELTWHAMDQIVQGTPIRRVVGEIMNATIEWKLADRAGEKEPESNREEYLERNLNDTRESLNHNAEALRRIKQEHDTLSAALTASEADVETLKKENETLRQMSVEMSKTIDDGNKRIRDLQKERDDAHHFNVKLSQENQKLRNGQVAQAQDITRLEKEMTKLEHDLGERAGQLDSAKETITQQRQEIQRLADKLVSQSDEMMGLRQAPEVIKREMNERVHDIAAQRDAEKQRADDNYNLVVRLQKQVSELEDLFTAAENERDTYHRELAGIRRRITDMFERDKKE